MTKRYLSTSEVAELLGISRVAVLKQIKTGRLKAIRIGRNYAIDIRVLGAKTNIVIEAKSGEDEVQIEQAMDRVLKEYSVALKRLGNE